VAKRDPHGVLSVNSSHSVHTERRSAATSEAASAARWGCTR
jgi:hypothetical protein